MLALAAALVALAQCPDGSPPPCRAGARPAIPSPALNDQTWLVLPFENTARAADAELIRQASVTQLYAELSQWTGVRVISDDRVADLLQQLPEAQRDRPGLETGRMLARRVGAGRLVLGGYLAAGGRANVTARVYDTRTGREVRVVRDPLAGFLSPAALDSLAASFGRLARGILDVPSGTERTSAGIGTSSIEAYRAYLAGMDAFNHLVLDSALARFERAIQFDSNYALARIQVFRLSVDPAEKQRHLQAAVRSAASLPPRERALVDGLAAQLRNDRETMCRAAAQVIGADSSDAGGWQLLAACHLDLAVVVDGGPPRLRGDLNRSLRAAERAYALAPNELSSLGFLVDVLGQGSFMQCVPPGTAGCPPERNYRVSLLPAGDSFVVAIAPWRDVRHAPPDLTPSAVDGQVQRLRRARSIAERLALTSNTWLLNNVLLPQLAIVSGDLGAAEATYGRGTPGAFDTLGGRSVYLRFRFELLLARERSAEFRAYAESLLARPQGLSGQYQSMLGRLGEGLDTSVAGRQNAVWRQILVGVLPAGFDTLEQTIAARLTSPAREDFLQLTTLAGFHLRRTGPALDTAARHPLKRYQAWFARGNAVRARAALAEFDRELLARHPVTPDDGGWLFSAESHQELGDTATAFERMQEFARRWPTSIQGAWILEMRSFQSTTPRLWGRAWLLYGDLATARGQRADARRAYRMVVGLWEQGDPVVQPFVSRARAALLSLGN